MALAGLRVGAITCDVKEIGIEQGEIVIRFWEAHYVNGYELGKKLGRQVMTKVNQIRMPVPDRNQILPTVRDALEFLAIAPATAAEPVAAKR